MQKKKSVSKNGRKEIYADCAEIYDDILTQSKIYNTGDKQFLEIINKHCEDKKVGITIFEPGCGTGLMTIQLAKIKNVRHIIAVDPSKDFFDFAKSRLENSKKVEIMNVSAVGLKTGPIDIAAMRFVYHHIRDFEKYKFIRNIYNSLRKSGKIVILDEFIPFYSNEEEWRKVLIEFHDNKVKIAMKLGDGKTAECEQDAKKLGLRKEDEYKVHAGILEGHLKNAGFLNIKKILVKHPELKDSRPLGMYLIIADKK